jgi:hypothetical protein
MSIEHIITKLLDTGDVATALNANIHAEFFHATRARKLWEWIYEYWVKHGEGPGLKAAKRQDPTFDFDETDEPMSALVDELRQHHLYLLTQDGLAEAVAKFDNAEGDPAPAIQQLNKLMSIVNVDRAAADVERMSSYLSDYIEMVLNGDALHTTGIPSGFEFIDRQLGGYHPEQLITIIGLPKRGKSTIALYSAMIDSLLGYRAGVISFEMSNAENKARQLSLGAHVNLNRIQRGQLTDIEKQRIIDWEAQVDEVMRETGGELILVHDLSSVTTVGGVAAKVEQLGLDIVYVDGVYMMQDELGEKQGSPQALTNITRGLKRMVQRAKIPCFCTTQASMFRTNKKSGTAMDSIMYTQSFAQDSDVIMGIDKPDLKKTQSIIKVIAARNAVGIEVDITVDLDHGVIKENGLVMEAGEIEEDGDYDDDE